LTVALCEGSFVGERRRSKTLPRFLFAEGIALGTSAAESASSFRMWCQETTPSDPAGEIWTLARRQGESKDVSVVFLP
jgi:hypothetical protein